MRKKILSIFLAVAILFLSVATSAVPVYASNSTNWEDYFSITYTATNIDSPYSLDFKSTTAESAYKKLSKDERKKIDYDAFMAISAKDQNHKFGNLVFNNTTIPDLIKGIAASSGMVMSGAPDDTGFTADLQDKLTRISNSISASNRKFGGKGISRKASSAHPNNFGLGTLTLSKDFINDLRANIAKFDDYTVYPALTENQDYYTSMLGLSHIEPNGDPYSNFGTFFQKINNGLVFFAPINASYISNGLKDYNTLYFMYGGNYIYYIDSTTKKLRALLYYPSGSYQVNKLDSCYYLINKNSSAEFDYLSRSSGGSFYGLPVEALLGRVGKYTIVYNSLSGALQYLNYLTGKSTSNYYISTEIVNNDYSTTINKIYDYSSHDTYTTINNNITQAITDKGSGLTGEEYQKIVDEVMKKVQQEIDSKDDSGNTGGGTGGDSGNTGGGSGGDSGNTGGGESDTWLEKIYNRLGDVLEKIGIVTGVDTLVSLVQQIADDIKTLKEGGTLSADLSDTNGLLKDIKKLLGTLIAVQAVGDIADLLADTVGDKINDYADNLKSAVTEVADTLQDVFPFSIPWDLMAILALFSAEPQAPVFDIPVNIPQLGVEHSIHVDLSDFESVSVICRAFLSLSFAVGLMYLTIRITGGKDDD